MSLKCLVGIHAWAGCKCSKCGKIRDEGHDWAADCEKCAKCGKAGSGAHAWTGCKCSKCKKTRDEGHEWHGCKCSKCGSYKKHEWQGFSCSRCGHPDYLALIVEIYDIGDSNSFLQRGNKDQYIAALSNCSNEDEKMSFVKDRFLYLISVCQTRSNLSFGTNNRLEKIAEAIKKAR
jgi:hypothetical protein